MFEEVKKLNKSVAIWLAIISLMSAGIDVGDLFITVAKPKHSHIFTKCNKNFEKNVIKIYTLTMHAKNRYQKILDVLSVIPMKIKV